MPDSALNQCVTRDQIDALPNTSGVYYFINNRAEVIYVGKSIAIKKRVKSHFASAKRVEKERKLALHTTKIAWQETAGELSALLLESHEIKRMQPFYNRRLRRQFKQYAWLLSEQPNGLIPKLTDAQWPPQGHEATPLYGSFRSLSHARKELMAAVKRNNLCAKMLGLEQSDGPCFAYQLKQCAGACVGQETTQSHNARLLAALDNLRLGDWPYFGLVGVIERLAPSEVNLFHQWHYLGTHDNNTISALAEYAQHTLSSPLLDYAKAQSAFELDRDSYKILLSFLARQPDSIEVIDYSLGLS